jgi:hypothetical protein
VAQKRLDKPKIDALLQQHRRHSVPENMGVTRSSPAALACRFKAIRIDCSVRRLPNRFVKK